MGENTLTARIHRVRFQKEEAAGEICSHCSCLIFGKVHRAYALIQIAETSLEEVNIEIVLCQSCCDRY